MALAAAAVPAPAHLRLALPAPSAPAAARTLAEARSWTAPGGDATRRRPAAAGAGLTAALVLAAGAARRRRGRRRGAAAVVLRASNAAATALQSETAPDEEDLRDIFAEASGGKNTATFDESIRLEGVDGVLEEGAVTMKEMQVLWGDDSVALGFKAWSTWYVQVLKLYDEFLWKDAVAPPADLLSDVEEELEEEEEDDDYTDEELLVDAPTKGQNLDQLLKKRAAEQANDQRQLPRAEPAPAAPQGSGRENFEITRLFREGCDDQNLLSFEALLEISEIADMLQQEEITKSELKGLWAELPSKGGSIDILVFKDLMGQVDDLFEYEDEEEAEELAFSEEDLELDDGDEEEEAKAPTPTFREPAIVKSELQAAIKGLQEMEKRPCGLDGREEADPGVTKLTDELERAWRAKLEDIAEFDDNELLGDWELVYSTSAKYRRWQSILNADVYVKKGVVDGLVQSFTIEPGTLAKDYDMEELFIQDEQEVGMRAFGAWSVGLQSNVVTGDDDLVLKLNLNSVEFDTKDGDVEQAEKKLLDSVMVRTFSYSFISYVDEEIRVMRTGLSGNSVFVYRRLQEKE